MAPNHRTRLKFARATMRRQIKDFRSEGVTHVYWLDSGDPATCPDCRERHGKTLTLEEVEALLPTPFCRTTDPMLEDGCRCCLIVARSRYEGGEEHVYDAPSARDMRPWAYIPVEFRRMPYEQQPRFELRRLAVDERRRIATRPETEKLIFGDRKFDQALYAQALCRAAITGWERARGKDGAELAFSRDEEGKPPQESIEMLPDHIVTEIALAIVRVGDQFL